MSPALSATGWKPFALYHCTIRSSPWLVKSFAALMSASVVIGFFENSCTQPALPQAEQLEALGLEPLLEHRRELLEHVLAFGIGLEEERDAEHVEGVVDGARGPGSISRFACS